MYTATTFKKSEGNAGFIEPSLVEFNIDKTIMSKNVLIYASLDKELSIEIKHSHTLMLNMGDVCILRPNVEHRLLSNKPNTAACIEMQSGDWLNVFAVIIKDCSEIAAFLIQSANQKNTPEYLLLLSTSGYDCTHLIHDIVEERLQMLPCYQTSILGQLVNLFAVLSREYKPLNKSHNTDGVDEMIIRLIAYLNANYSSATLESTAAHFCYHPDYVSSMIKKHIGMGFTKLLQSIRMEHACVMLKETSMSICDIANQCGYKNMSHFYNVFNNRYNMTPKQYRQEHD